jgi:hypothetical protein
MFEINKSPIINNTVFIFPQFVVIDTPLAAKSVLAAELAAVGAAIFVPVNLKVFPLPAHALPFRSMHIWSTSVALNVDP